MPDDAPPAGDADRPEPSPDLGPDDVVRIQLRALAHNDEPYADAGIETAYRFASPANKINTGPLARFKQMVKNELYRPMLYHQNARVGGLEMKGGRAQQLAILTTAEGQRVAYLFVLSKRTGGTLEGCWTTDGVQRVALAPRGDGAPGGGDDLPGLGL
jgi:hypothetical protein